jgi:hypothetical protein
MAAPVFCLLPSMVPLSLWSAPPSATVLYAPLEVAPVEDAAAEGASARAVAAQETVVTEAPAAEAPAETTDAPVEDAASEDATGEEVAAPKFIRLTRDDDDELLSMDTAVVTYEGTSPDGKPVTVDLVGAVHIAEKSYYEAINKQLDTYDVVLYELVAPKDDNVPTEDRGSTHPIAILQNGMKNMLKLELQLEHVDYEKDHFVHADMSPEEFSKSMADRRENFFTMYIRMMQQNLARQRTRPSKINDLDLIRALLDRRQSHVFKQLMAEQFEDMEAMTNALSGPDGSAIITDRNQVALGVLSEQLKQGKKKVGIFFGAGHLPDMEQRLLADFGMKRQGETWLEAWDLCPESQRKADEDDPSDSSDEKKSSEDTDSSDAEKSSDEM